MTARKGVVPKGSKLSSDKNEWFEALALRELERLPIPSWAQMYALWKTLPEAHPAARRRILAHCLRLAVERQEALPAKFLSGVYNHVGGFADQVIRELGIRADRNAVKNKAAFRAAARNRANKPEASLADLAQVASTTKGTVRQWLRRPDFKRLVDDEAFLSQLDNKRAEEGAPAFAIHSPRGRNLQKESRASAPPKKNVRP